MWAAAEIYMTIGKGSDILTAASLGKVLCSAAMWFCPRKCKNEVRHWLAMVIWLCYLEDYLEGGGIWVRFWRSTGLSVSFDYKRVHDIQPLGKTVCQEEKNHPYFLYKPCQHFVLFFSSNIFFTPCIGIYVFPSFPMVVVNLCIPLYILTFKKF